MEARVQGVDLSAELDILTHPKGDLRRVRKLVVLSDGTVVVALSASVVEPETLLYVVRPEETSLQPVPGVADVDGLWAAGCWVLVQADDALDLVDTSGARCRVIDLPAGTECVDVAWQSDGLRAAALVDAHRTEGAGTVIYPADRGERDLMTYAPSEGWVVRTQVRDNSSSLSMSRSGNRIVWRESVNVVPEEAMRGEFRAYDTGTGEVTTLTDGAGKARGALMHPGGNGTLYVANFSVDRPITTHTDLWWHPWGADDRVNLTGGDSSIDSFGWRPDGESVWVTLVDGTERITRFLDLEGRELPESGEWSPGAASDVVLTSGFAAYEVESADSYPTLMVGTRQVSIPQPEAYDDILCTTHSWLASDGMEVFGVLWECAGSTESAPLLVRAHGGPAGEVEAVRSEGVRFRSLLRAGYRLFIPAFRGSLGFGDAFLGANIGCQGVGDLDDIVTGIDYLAAHGKADPDRVGIFGGSYGGYMTLRAMAVSDRFCAGVAYYGFLDNRWMTLETGDFTYETEYLGPVTWPRTENSLVSDVFSHLGDIDQPVLLLHGDADPICPWHQSLVAFRALEARDVATQLVVYPGEGHGFRDPEHVRDASRRTLAWFLEHLSP